MLNLSEIVARSKGKFISVSFHKKDGTLRVMNCRTGVIKHLKGGQCTLNRDQYLIVYDLIKKGYRAINKESIVSVTIGGDVITQGA